MEIKRVSATSEKLGVRNEETLCMLIDTTTCIGCKACEVACVEWNDLRLEPEYHERVLESYQTMPDMTPSYWNLIKFNEMTCNERREPAADGSSLMWLMRKDMCMHCAEPGCLLACPAEGAIVQYSNGIVDFHQQNCIGCGYCMTGCPFNIPKFDAATHRVYKCTMCSDRVSEGLGPACVKACPTGCLQFGEKPKMEAAAKRRAEQVRGDGFKNAGVYDPAGVGGTGVIYVLHYGDRPELYGGLPKDPTLDPISLWKGPLKWFGGIAMAASMVTAAVHYFRTGPRKTKHIEGSREIVRYTVAERTLHWTVALTFLYLTFTGLGLFTPKLDWLLSVFGGGQVVRAWHPIVGCAFVIAVVAQFVKWFRDLLLGPDDRAWLKRMREYLAGRDENVPPSGRFNAGQKMLFWSQVLLGLVLLTSGVPIWFPESFSRELRLWALVIHSASAVIAVLSLVVHIYMATIVTEGALRAMTQGKVTEEWARHHHGKWAEQKLR